MTSSTVVVHPMVSSTMDPSPSDPHFAQRKSMVEETMRCTTVLDDVIHRFLFVLKGDISVNIGRRNSAFGLMLLFLLCYKIQASKHDFLTNAAAHYFNGSHMNT